MEPCNKYIQKTGLFHARKVDSWTEGGRFKDGRDEGERRRKEGVMDRRMKEGRNERREGGRRKDREGESGITGGKEIIYGEREERRSFTEKGDNLWRKGGKEIWGYIWRNGRMDRK